ncbi:MAG: hypothetical protein WCL51_14115 [Bacteroidota bacterium]
MCGFFSRTLPPTIDKQDLELGLEKNIDELNVMRVSRGFKILSLKNQAFPTDENLYYIQSINAQKFYKGGFSIQLMNEINRKYTKCNIFFIEFTEEEVIKIMDTNFQKISEKRWKTHDNRFLTLQKYTISQFEIKCSDPNGNDVI